MNKELKLEVGKKYLTRSGEIVEIVNYYEDDTFQYKSKTQSYIKNGQVFEFSTNDGDLIEELIEDDGEIKQINMNKKYRTRDGRDVEILNIKESLEFPVIGLLSGVVVAQQWGLDGAYHKDSHASDLDLIEIKPYEDFKIDDKVLVRELNGQTWTKRYFAGISNNGEPLVFMQGATSWSVKDDDMVAWDECVKWENRTPDMQIM